MLERIFNWLKKFISSILTFFKVIIQSSFFLKKFKAQNETCIILGNGPSLNKVLEKHLSKLSTKSLLCVNQFPLTPYFTKLKPDYYIFVSDEYWKFDTIDPNTELRKNIINALVENTTWDLVVFAPARSKSNKAFIKKIKSNSHLQLYFYNKTPVEGLKSINLLLMSYRLACPRPHNVLIPSIYVCILSNFKKIILLGADHSWLPMISVTEENITLVNKKHFYDESTAKGELMYRHGKNPRKLHEVLEKFMYSFRSYFDLKKFADAKNAKVYNCTKGSFIDAFERKPIEDFL